MKPGWLLVAMLSGCGLPIEAIESISGGGRQQAEISATPIGPLFVATAVGQAPPRRKGKHWIYHLLDALILSSPLTGIMAVAMFMDPEVRDRPPGLLSYREIEGEGLRLWPGVRRRILLKMALLFGAGGACLAGLLALLLHLLNLIPKLN